MSKDIFGSRTNTTDRLRRLRLRMKASGYDAYIVPTANEHLSESVAEYDKRREFISGFTGTAGTAVILSKSAALWTDGRYFLQAEKELDCNWLLMKKGEKDTPRTYTWIIKNLNTGQRVGADSNLISYTEWTFLDKKLHEANLTLFADESNLIDDIWSIAQGRVPESVAHVFIHDVKYAGKTWQEKVEELRRNLMSKPVNGTIISALDEIAWLYNLRGGDLPNTPIFKAYSLVTSTQIRLYIKSLKVSPEIEQYLCPNITNELECVKVEDYAYAFEDMKKIISQVDKILIPSHSSYALIDLVPKGKRVIDDNPSPISSMKVIKNSVEIAGMKNAALKDSVALVDFIAMLEGQVRGGKHWDEIKAANTLTLYRKEQELNQGESFPTISAVGPNSAVIHYTPKISTNLNINNKSIYLLDSGGQYLDGTCDITRTFHFGKPTEFEIETYTRVLMGAIDLMMTVFPEQTLDSKIDIIARLPLYKVGLDYQHGTGHGIGYFLDVHEGPIKIRNEHNFAKSEILKPGMFLSDEPGYYETGKFGIRLETMMMVVAAHTPYHFNNLKFYTFDPVSFVPFDPKLIDIRLLSKKQIDWLNWFNMKARNTVGIELKKQGREQGLRYLLSKTEFITPNPGVNSGRKLCTKVYFVVVFVVLILLY